MPTLMWWSVRIGILMTLVGINAPLRAQVAPFICAVSVSVAPVIRAEGLTEPVGDLVLHCNGGQPTTPGQPVPQVNLTIFLNANATSKVTAPGFNFGGFSSGAYTEALLLMDEPDSPFFPPASLRPVLNCGQTGAPDNGPSGPGACSIVSTNNPAQTYDGSTNTNGAAVCDGVSGVHPLAANSYGCGRPNVFQGRMGTPQNPNQQNALTFLGVPFDPPGSTTNRTLRITNARVNAATFGVGQGSLSEVQMNISVNGPTTAALSNPQQVVAYVNTGLYQAACGAAAASTVRLCEGFASSWKTKNLSFTVGDHNGTPGNATFNPTFMSYTYNGGANYPADVALNIPGAIYNTESGFEWQNNTTNAPPSPNPPPGFGFVATVPNRGTPLGSVGYGGENTNINSAGVVNFATRVALRFSNLPPGASVSVPLTVSIKRQGSTTVTGVLVLTNTDSAGGGPFSPAVGGILGAGNMAVYELLYADPFSLEYADIPYSIVNGGVNPSVTVTSSFAPFYTSADAGQASASDFVPRFIDPASLASCPPALASSCITVFPNQGFDNGPVHVQITGSPILNGAQVKLSGNSVADIPGTGTFSPSPAVLSTTFNLTGAIPGSRDLVFTPVGSGPVTIPRAFAILQAPACAFTVGPLNPSFPASGGSRRLVVTPSAPGCTWGATSNAAWIVLGARSRPSSPIQPYSVDPNLTGGPRSGTIGIAGKTVTVSQASNCIYTLNPTSKIFDVGGGPLTINVTTGAGCTWTAVSNTSWAHITGGSFGPGSGVVAVQADANPGGLRSGTLTIAGQTYNVKQSASACGATDVSSQVSVTQGSFQSGFTGTYWTQQLWVTNQGASGIPGPVYLVFDGLPMTGGQCSAFSVSGGPQTCRLASFQRTTYCQSPNGSEMVLFAPNGLAPGQQLPPRAVTFLPGVTANAGPPSWYTLRVFSGTPNQ